LKSSFGAAGAGFRPGGGPIVSDEALLKIKDPPAAARVCWMLKNCVNWTGIEKNLAPLESLKVAQYGLRHVL